MTPYFLLAQEGWNWFGFGAGVGIIVLLVAIAAVILWIWGMIDAATNTALDPAARIVWLLVIFFLPAIGTIAYFILRPSHRAVGPGGTMSNRL
jgi:hypothetical protein